MRITHQNETYNIDRVYRVTGCGSKFDGRMKYELTRISDGSKWGWLGSRLTKKLPANAKLHRSI